MFRFILAFVHSPRSAALLSVCAILTISTAHAANEFQPFNIPNGTPGDFDDIKKVVIEGESDDPMENIHKNLEKAMCGGWDFGFSVNGVFGQPEALCGNTATLPIGAACLDEQQQVWIKVQKDGWAQVPAPSSSSASSQSSGASSSSISTISDEEMNGRALKTEADRGLIAKVEGVPGRDAARAYGNMQSGLGERREEGGNTRDTFYDPIQKKRILTEKTSGFDFPNDTRDVCGLATLCRTTGHRDLRTLPPIKYQNAPHRDRPKFFCEHPCQRPLDDPGKPGNWDEEDSKQAECGSQDYYQPEDEKIYYACGGGETKGPGEDFCGELRENGQLGGVCQDMNNWVYPLWKKKVHICLEISLFPPSVGTETIYRYEKGDCGFPKEVLDSAEADERLDDGWEMVGLFECCSDKAFAGTEYSEDYKGFSCIPCTGQDCRLMQGELFARDENDELVKANEVIINDQWLDPFPGDLAGGCRIGVPQDQILYDLLIDSLILAGLDPTNLGVNIGAIDVQDENLRKKTEEREYISFFREYTNARYERHDLKAYVEEDDHKKENIPVACYGMYDSAPEDVKNEASKPQDKRCVIAAYYEVDDGDGDEANFLSMEETQKGKAQYESFLDDTPFEDEPRPFDKKKDLWFPILKNKDEDLTLGGFSMLNDAIFAGNFRRSYSTALLNTDSAKQRAIVQVDLDRTLSKGGLLRAPDDTITNDEDLSKERRTIVQWWQQVQTQMHSALTAPSVSIILPSPWSINLDALDPLFTGAQEVEPRKTEDVQAQTIAVQVGAREDLLGNVVGFLSRSLLLRIEPEPIPVVVPFLNPTELRAIAHGWETWAIKQEEHAKPGASQAREVANQILAYADQADAVREIRTYLPRMAAKLIEQQTKMQQALTTWELQNAQAYSTYRFMAFIMQILQQFWQNTQSKYRALHDDIAFPWCKNDRFTTPIYSMLDAWLPGRDNEGDTTGGFKPYIECLQEAEETGIEQYMEFKAQLDEEQSKAITFLAFLQQGFASCRDIDLSIFSEYMKCIDFVIDTRKKSPGTFPTIAACDQHFPIPPLLPAPPKLPPQPDLVLDFTAFKAMAEPIKLPVLKPIQIKLKFEDIRPPALEQDTLPDFPELAPLPSIPEDIYTLFEKHVPNIERASETKTRVLQDAPSLSLGGADVEGTLPKIAMPSTRPLDYVRFLGQSNELIDKMKAEYDKFWSSILMRRCTGNEKDGCVFDGTEQDCVDAGKDPNNRCVHFEFDLKERFQRIAARPALFLKEDFFSAGSPRQAVTHGQQYCEKEDFACQLFNFYSVNTREGWQVHTKGAFDPNKATDEMKKAVREATQNTPDQVNEPVLYDTPAQKLLDTFNVPNAPDIQIPPTPFKK